MKKANLIIKEFAGALGDLPLFFAFLIAFTQLLHFNPLTILFWTGLAHIGVGLIFKVPLPMQPMKALGIYAVAHGLSQGEILAAGLAMALLLFVLNGFGLLKKVYDYFPKALIRGIQLGLGLLLLREAAHLFTLSMGSVDGDVLKVILAGGLLLFAFLLRRSPHIVILSFFAIAFVLLWQRQQGISFVWGGGDFLQWRFSSFEFSREALFLVLIQLPLTVANSVFAPTLLIKDYFPERKISPSALCCSVGFANLLTLPFGSMPVCHGAGGLAAQHRFGARSGLSIILLGLMKIAAALFAGSLFLGLAEGFPKLLLGILFLFPAVDLCRLATDVRGGRNIVTLWVTALSSFFWNAAVALTAGLLVYCVGHCFETKEWPFRKRRRRYPEDPSLSS